MSDRQFERAVLDWLGDGLDRTPRPAIDAVLLAVKTTPQERELALPRRFTTMTSSLRLLAAAIALVAIVGGGAIWYAGLSTNPSPPASTQSPIPSLAAAPTAFPSPSVLDQVWGWPSTSGSGPGLFSWDGGRCAGRDCIPGFMHNGYGAGDVAITIRELPEQPTLPGATAVTFVGHSALYRRFVEPEPSFAWGSMHGPHEVWIVDIDGVLVEIAIRPDADSGISAASLADAHAIIDSMRYERTDRPTRGFRLVFTLTNRDWDSG